MSKESNRRLKKRKESVKRKGKERNKIIAEIIANRNSLPSISFSDLYGDIFKLKQSGGR